MLDIQLLRIETEQASDGSYVASVPDLPGVKAYGETAVVAISKAREIALQLLTGMVDKGEDIPDALKVLFAT